MSRLSATSKITLIGYHFKLYQSVPDQSDFLTLSTSFKKRTILIIIIMDPRKSAKLKRTRVSLTMDKSWPHNQPAPQIIISGKGIVCSLPQGTSHATPTNGPTFLVALFWSFSSVSDAWYCLESEILQGTPCSASCRIRSNRS